MKNKKQKRFINGEERALRFNLYHNGLFKQKIIPNKKKALSLKRKKVDIREYQPFLLSNLFNKICFYSLLNFSIKS